MDVWLPVITTAVINLAVAAYVYGKLTQKVSHHADQIGELEAEDRAQWRKLDDHETRISTVEGRLTRGSV